MSGRQSPVEGIPVRLEGVIKHSPISGLMVDCAIGVLESWRKHPIRKALGMARLCRARAEVAIEPVRVVRVDKASRMDIVE